MTVNKKQPSVGFDRYITFDWLDQTAKWVIEGKSAKNVHELIDAYLAPHIHGDTSKRKTKNILSGAWVKCEGVNLLFKEQARTLYPQVNKTEKLTIHFGLMLASYPFFYSLSRILGRLFKLQEDISNDEFYRRVIETHGDRESIKRAAARFLQSLIEWGILNGSDKAKVKSVSKVKITDPLLATWLFESAMYSNRSETISLDTLLADPAFFAFDIPPGVFQIDKSAHLKIVHQGAHETIIKMNSC